MCSAVCCQSFSTGVEWWSLYVFWHTHCGIPVLLSIVVVMVSCYVVLHSECL